MELLNIRNNNNLSPVLFSLLDFGPPAFLYHLSLISICLVLLISICLVLLISISIFSLSHKNNIILSSLATLLHTCLLSLWLLGCLLYPLQYCTFAEQRVRVSPLASHAARQSIPPSPHPPLPTSCAGHKATSPQAEREQAARCGAEPSGSRVLSA